MISLESTPILETVNGFQQRIKELETQFHLSGKSVYTSADLEAPSLKENSGLIKTPVIHDVSAYNMCYIVNAPVGFSVPEHVHESDISDM
jgi:hypothetical protein